MIVTKSTSCCCCFCYGRKKTVYFLQNIIALINLSNNFIDFFHVKTVVSKTGKSQGEWPSCTEGYFLYQREKISKRLCFFIQLTTNRRKSYHVKFSKNSKIENEILNLKMQVIFCHKNCFKIMIIFRHQPNYNK